MPNGGFLELIEDTSGGVRIWSQSLRSVNFDDGGALHPNLPLGPHDPKSGYLLGTYSPSYSSSTNDVEEDGKGTNITGTHLTAYRISKTEAGKVQVQLIIYNTSALSVIANRTLVSE